MSDSTSVSLMSFLEEVFLPEVLANGVQDTARKYRTAVRLFSTHLGREATLADLEHGACRGGFCHE